MTISRARLAGVDSVRYLLCFAVALLHSLPGVSGVTAATWATVTAIACRAAVPFFFVASGYFMRVPSRWTMRVVAKPLIRLLPVYLLWYLIYAAIDTMATGHLDVSLSGLATGGSAFHLWFLPVLGLTLAAIPTGIVMIGARGTAIVAAALAIGGVVFGAYRGALHLSAIGGVRMTMAPALVLAGYWIGRTGVRVSGPAAIIAVLLSIVLVTVEEQLIASVADMAFTSHDVVFATYPLGCAVFLLALGLEGFGSTAGIAKLGRVSLGVYASHLLFVRLLMPWTGNLSLLPCLALAFSATLLATALCLGIDRLPVARKLVG